MAKQKDGVEPTAPLYRSPAVVAALIAAAASLLTWFLTHQTPDPPPELTYHFSVKDSAANDKPIPGAKVTLTVTATKVQLPPKVDDTDSNGSVFFKLSKDNFNTLGRISVAAKGYDSFNANISIPSSDTYAAILLAPTPAAIAPTPPLQPYTKTSTLGPVPSGAGKSFSAPFVIESEPPRDGYKIVSASYSLAGDRTCNAWSTCRWRQNDENRAVFEFTLQGHDEWQSPGQGLSTGTLTVTYGPK